MSAARARGTAWESAVVSYLQARGYKHAERRALHGAKDRGDIAGIPGICIEAKNTARVDLAGWLDEARQEAAHAADLGVVWFKRRGKTSPGNGYVLMDGDTFTALLDLAGFNGRRIDSLPAL